MRIWRAVQGEGSKLGVWPEPRVLYKCLGLEVWRRGGGGMLLNYQWNEVRLLNLHIHFLSLIAECTPLVLIN